MKHILIYYFIDFLKTSYGVFLLYASSFYLPNSSQVRSCLLTPSQLCVLFIHETLFYKKILFYKNTSIHHNLGHKGPPIILLFIQNDESL